MVLKIFYDMRCFHAWVNVGSSEVEFWFNFLMACVNGVITVVWGCEVLKRYISNMVYGENGLLKVMNSKNESNLVIKFNGISILKFSNWMQTDN